jgi:hypothetical protein
VAVDPATTKPIRAPESLRQAVDLFEGTDAKES